MTTGIIVAGAVVALGLVVWLYGRAQRAAGRAESARAQSEEALDAREDMDRVEPAGRDGTAGRLRDGEF